MPAGAVTVRTVGLRELQRDLKQSEDRVDKDIRKELRHAAEIVASDARSRVPVGPGKKGFHARDTIKGGADTARAFIIGGKDVSPYYGWLDFGSRTPMRSGAHTNQTRSGRRAIARGVSGRRVGPWANSGAGPKGGRFIYPALEAKSAEVVKLITKAVDHALKAENL